MKIRGRVLPRSASDTFSTGFLLIVVPLIYWFELWIVLPKLFTRGSIQYIFHFGLGNFIMINIVGNYTYTVLCDTSIQQFIIPVVKASAQTGWRFCSICESVAPPRSWHCNTCDTCILKRDHHCLFTGCCIGHYNHRYFLMFILYLFIATMYAFVYNNFFIWNIIEFEFPTTIIKLIFPLAIFVFGFDDSIHQFYLMLYIVTVMGMLFCGALCFYHFHLVWIGCTPDESNKKDFTHNLGFKQNFKNVLGKRWFAVWLLPYIQSELPQNGISWRRSVDKHDLKSE